MGWGVGCGVWGVGCGCGVGVWYEGRIASVEAEVLLPRTRSSWASFSGYLPIRFGLGDDLLTECTPRFEGLCAGLWGSIHGLEGRFRGSQGRPRSRRAPHGTAKEPRQLVPIPRMATRRAVPQVQRKAVVPPRGAAQRLGEREGVGVREGGL